MANSPPAPALQLKYDDVIEHLTEVGGYETTSHNPYDPFGTEFEAFSGVSGTTELPGPGMGVSIGTQLAEDTDFGYLSYIGSDNGGYNGSSRHFFVPCCVVDPKDGDGLGEGEMLPPTLDLPSSAGGLDAVRVTYKDIHNYEHFLQGKSPAFTMATEEEPEDNERQMVSVAVQTDTETYGCTVCVARFSRRDNLTRHVQTVHDTCSTPAKRYTCTTCGTVIKRRDNFAVHRRLCRGKETAAAGGGNGADAPIKPPPRHPCPTCGRQFNRIQELRRHVSVVHNKETPYTCDRCDFKTSHKYLLTRHTAQHHSARMSACICSRCHVDFRTVARLREHRRQPCDKESTETVCELCWVYFKDTAILENHYEEIHAQVDLETFRSICAGQKPP